MKFKSICLSLGLVVAFGCAPAYASVDRVYCFGDKEGFVYNDISSNGDVITWINGTSSLTGTYHSCITTTKPS